MIRLDFDSYVKRTKYLNKECVRFRNEANIYSFRGDI